MADLEELQRELRDVQEDIREAERQTERVSSEINNLSRMVDEAGNKLQRIDGDLS